MDRQGQQVSQVCSRFRLALPEERREEHGCQGLLNGRELVPGVGGDKCVYCQRKPFEGIVGRCSDPLLYL